MFGKEMKFHVLTLDYPEEIR